MDKRNIQNHSAAGSADFSFLYRQLKPARGGMVVMGIIFAFFGLIFLHITKPKYDVTLLVTQVPSERMTSVASGLSSVFASSLNIGALNGASSDPSFKLYLETLFSQAVADKLATDKLLMSHVFADYWDADRKDWTEPSPTSQSAKNFIKTMLAIPVRPWHAPGGEEMAKYIFDNLTVDNNMRNQIVTLTIRTKDPASGLELLSKLNVVADQYLRQAALKRSGAYVDYLMEKLKVVTVTEYRQALINTLGDQEKRLMMASANVPFSSQTFGPPHATERPVSPKLIIVLPLFIAVGVFLNVIMTVLENSTFLRFNRWSLGLFVRPRRSRHDLA